MKIIIYCQHVLGVGHFFRTLEIAKAMKNCDVLLVTGGGKIDAVLPDHIRHIPLPGLMMDKAFTDLHSVDSQKSVDDVKRERQKCLLDLVKLEQPDIFLVELYPFGRRAFRFELIPVLDYIKDTLGTTCKVICSLRDILVEKRDTAKYETRVINALNDWFDAVMIHSDPRLIQLGTTFNRIEQIKIPLVYTGFVTPVPDQTLVRQMKQKFGLNGDKKLIVASAGGGNVGAQLLKAVVQAYTKLPLKHNIQLNVYTGPYMDDRDKRDLRSHECDGIDVKEFAQDFVSLLGACDLSISMAGYNTCMNIVSANVPSLVWPFNQNREQMARARKIAQFAAPMTILDDQDLTPDTLSELIHAKLNLNRQTEKPRMKLDINGAFNTIKWIKEQVNR